MSKSQLVNPELAAVEVHGMTRQSFIMKGALTAGAVYGTAAVGPFLSQALAQDGGGDIDIVNYALTLEYLESAFYKEALKKVSLPGELKTLVELISKDEAEHVDALKATAKKLGGKPAAVPTVDFGPAFKTKKSFLKLAQVFEDTGVSAYNGAAPMIKSTDVLAAAGSIVQVEARHVAAIRLQNDDQPAPDAFDKPLEMDKVLAAVKPFIKS